MIEISDDVVSRFQIRLLNKGAGLNLLLLLWKSMWVRIKVRVKSLNFIND